MHIPSQGVVHSMTPEMRSGEAPRPMLIAYSQPTHPPFNYQPWPGPTPPISPIRPWNPASPPSPLPQETILIPGPIMQRWST